MELPKIYFLGFGAVLLLTLLVSEWYYPARVYSKKQKRISYTTNTLTFLLNQVLWATLRVTSLYFIVEKYRLFDWSSFLPLWLQIILGFIFLDLMIWVWHLLNHRSNFLWRFHKTHHADRYLNVTSGLRFHFGELFLSVLFKAMVLFVSGVPFFIFFLYEYMITFFALFHHTNIRFPKRIQSLLGIVIITQDMHRAHHSTVRHEHDSNYGVMFSWWDKLFGTYNKKQPDNIGLKGVKSQNILAFLRFPFQKK